MAKYDPTHDVKFEKYYASLKARGYENLQPSKLSSEDPLLIDKLAAEGKLLLDLNKTIDPFMKDDPKKLENKLGEKSKNPYVKARIKVLGDMPLSRKDRILEAEKSGKLDTPDYRDFVKMIIKIAEETLDKP